MVGPYTELDRYLPFSTKIRLSSLCFSRRLSDDKQEGLSFNIQAGRNSSKGENLHIQVVEAYISRDGFCQPSWHVILKISANLRYRAGSEMLAVCFPGIKRQVNNEQLTIESLILEYVEPSETESECESEIWC